VESQRNLRPCCEPGASGRVERCCAIACLRWSTRARGGAGEAARAVGEAALRVQLRADQRRPPRCTLVDGGRAARAMQRRYADVQEQPAHRPRRRRRKAACPRRLRTYPVRVSRCLRLVHIEVAERCVRIDPAAEEPLELEPPLRNTEPAPEGLVLLDLRRSSIWSSALYSATHFAPSRC
jgi:hypothetical protein